MYLQDVTITGFKSFAKRSQLEFPATVTAIVGPNGSGKSNVAEALRFVLGEQSVKSMRGKRGEDLIWGGSEALGRANRASVSVTINNEQKVLPLDTERVVVERVVHRDGQNEYKINDQSVRLKDVHELLAAGNIGPSGHHIISQGEADRVLSATPTERRAMIEDALGLKVYQYKKSDAEKKLAKTEQNIVSVQDLRKEIAPHLAYLTRELDKKAEAEALRAKLHDAYAEYLRREDVYLAHRYDIVSEALREIEQKLGACQEAVAKLAAQEESTDPAHEDDDPLQDHTHAITEMRKKREELAEQCNRLAGRHAALTEQLAVVEKESDEVMVPLSAVEETVAVAEQELRSAADVDDVSGMRQRFKAAIDSLRSFVAGFQKTPKADKAEELRTQVATVHAEQTELEKELTAMQAKERELQAAYDAALRARDEARAAQQAATRELYEQKTALAELQAEQRRYTHEREIIERERHAFKDELQEAVALLGRNAAQYFTYDVLDTDGAVVDMETMQEEAREVQHGRKRALEKMKIRLETLGDGTAEDLTEEYRVTKERDDFLAHEITDLEQSVETLQKLIADLDAQIDEQFQTGFRKIQQEFQNFFALMFGGGTAELRLVEEVSANDDEDDDADRSVSRGIDLSVQLPNKRIQGLAMLSGGERALTSIALIFAMSQLHPPLFIVLDETDAALDEANSRRYGDLIEALAKRSQLILITHNRETMSRAGVLYGVTMGGDGVSKLLSVQLEEAFATAK